LTLPSLAATDDIITPGAMTVFKALPNGIEVHGNGSILQVLALRDDLLRVRISVHGSLPEDASWAVLPDARASRVSVVADKSAHAIGFHTQSLNVQINAETLALSVRDRAGNLLQQDARPVEFHGKSFRVSKVMPADEHYFGLGDKTGPFDRREHAFTLWNTDAYLWQESTDPLYKSIPFFMAFRCGVTIGVLFDNTWRSSFDFGKQDPRIYSFGAVDGPLDYYILYGPSPKQVLSDYAWLTGVAPLPPLWAFGYQQSRYSYTPQARVLEVAQRLRDDKIPADVIYLDIDFQYKNRPFTIDREHFPQFEEMIRKLHDANFHVVAITDLHIANAPHQHYAPYDSGVADDDFVRASDGSIYSGKVWPGMSVFPDFTQDKTRRWWGSLYREFSGMGIDGFWNDMGEPSVFDTPTLTMPENVVHRIEGPGFTTRKATHAEIHNVYGMENSRATYEGQLRIKPNERPFVLTRATYAGGQRYAATWTGDNSSTWNHLRLTTPMLKNLGLSGFAFSGADVGGYAGTPSAELLTKWLEIGAFQPIDRDHTEKGTGDQEPWVGGPEPEAIRRRFIEERYKLLPYIYTAAEEASRTGIPMLRPLFVEFPLATDDRHPIDLDRYASSEFLLGANLLIAPTPYPDELDSYDVEFPSAGWYDYWTGQRVSDPAPVSSDPAATDPNSHVTLPTIHVEPGIAALPVYVRPGTILPMAPLVQSTVEAPRDPLTLRVYPGPNCSGSLYQDDGKTFAYRQGAFLRMDFRCEIVGDELHVHVSPHHGTYPAWWHTISVEIFGIEASRTITVNGRAQGLLHPLRNGAIAVTVPDTGQGIEITVSK
jgi:alpha-glucosidase